MHQTSNTHMRFFDVAALVSRHFDFCQDPCVWMTAATIAEVIGVPVTKGSSVQIGRWASDKGLKTRRSNGARLILVPQPIK